MQSPWKRLHASNARNESIMCNVDRHELKCCPASWFECLGDHPATMVKFEDIKKEYDPRIIQTTQRSFAPFHDQSPAHALKGIKYSASFTVKNKKRYPSASLSVLPKTGHGDILKPTKSHGVAPAIAASLPCPDGCTKTLQAINFFTETEKRSSVLSTISKISCSQMSSTKPKQERTNTNEYGKWKLREAGNRGERD